MIQNRHGLRSFLQVRRKFKIAFVNFRKSNKELSSAIAQLIKATKKKGNSTQVNQLRQLEDTLKEIERLTRLKEKKLDIE